MYIRDASQQRDRHRTYHGKHRMAYEKKASAGTLSRTENKVG